MTDNDQVYPTFDEWFDNNSADLEPMMRNNQTEALYEAWLAGYKAGLNEMGSFAKDLWKI